MQTRRILLQNRRIQLQTGRIQLQNRRIQLQTGRIQLQKRRTQLQTGRIQLQSRRIQLQKPVIYIIFCTVSLHVLLPQTKNMHNCFVTLSKVIVIIYYLFGVQRFSRYGPV